MHAARATRTGTGSQTPGLLPCCVAVLLALMRWAVWLAIGLVVPVVAMAQTYAYRNDVFAYDAPTAASTSVAWHASGSSPGCTSYPLGDDDWADIVFPTGLAFTFGGVSYSGVRAYSNGILAFGTDVSGFHRAFTATALPVTTAPGGAPAGCPNAVPARLMMPYWIDIIAGTAGGITGAAVKYEALGTAPNRRFVITWNNVALYGNAATRYSFQVALYESTAGVNGNFRYQYTTGSSTGSSATVGVQLSGADYTQYAFNQNFIDTTVGTSIVWYPANQLATKSAEYRFDEGAWLGVAAEIKDTSGNSQNASRVGLASNIAGGKLCRGGSFTANTLNTTIDAVATPVVPGNQGAVDFWFNSNIKWNTSAAMLLDATTTANRPFYLLKSATGALTFVVSDSAGTTATATAPAQSFALNTWHHVGVAWNVRAGTNQTTLQIFLDGVLQNGTPTRATTNGAMPALGSLYLGDNRSAGVTPNGGTPNGANGVIDEVYIYGIEISAPQALADSKLTRPTCTSLDHFHVVHDGAVSNCSTAASITIEAHDPLHNLFTLAGTSILLSTSTGHGTWSNVAGGAINTLTGVGAGTGTASYTFANESRVTFGLTDTVSESLAIRVASGSITEQSGTAALCVPADATYAGGSCNAPRSFVCATAFGFNCVESGANALSGRLNTKLAGTAFSFDVVALKDANADGVADAVETAFASDTDKNVLVELVDGSGSTACSARAAISPAVSQTLGFLKSNQATEQGRKTIAALTVAKGYRDLRCRVTDASQSPSIVSCSSDDFAVRPSGLSLSTTASATPPSAGSAVTVAAGTAFTLQASISSDTSYLGSLILDSSKLGAQQTTQDSTQVTGGTVGTLAPSLLTANTAVTTATYSEVGYVYLGAGAYRDEAYSAVDQPAGCAASASCDCLADSSNRLSNSAVGGRYGCFFGNTTPVSLGRFVPHHFAVTTSAMAPACAAGGYTYMDQPFSASATIEAQNAANAKTQNYSAVFARAGASGVVGQAVNASNGVPLGARLRYTAPWVGGAASFVATQFARPTSLVPDATWGAYDAMTLGLVVNDPDLVTLQGRNLDESKATCVADAAGSSSGNCPAVAIATGKFRYGRLRLQNAYGSQQLDLQMPLEAQYWNGSGYARNTLDSCTALATANVNLTNHQGGVNTTNMGPGHVSAVAPFAAGLSSVRLAKPTPPSTLVGNLDVFLNIGSSGAASTCPISNASPQGSSTVAALPFLASNWCGATSYDRAPSARASLGIYKSPLIYRRENY